MTLQMTLDLRVTKIEHKHHNPYRAVLLCNGHILSSARFESPADALFLLRQFLFPRCDGIWKEIGGGSNAAAHGPRFDTQRNRIRNC